MSYEWGLYLMSKPLINQQRTFDQRGIMETLPVNFSALKKCLKKSIKSIN